jgi:hypothetical protein
MPRRGLPLAILLAGALPAQTLIWPGERIATIDAQHLRAYVPAAQAERLRPLVARADQIYAHMQRDAGVTPSDKLRVLFYDFEDQHNGYSFVVPFPLVQVQLAPALGPSTIFAGGLDVERTLIHEFAHQLGNDRNRGFRRGLESVFGRVLPNDLLSMVLWYLSTPPHQTMPRFWHEGTAIWAETEYADPQSVWRGRGRDPMTHLQWRLDAQAGTIPDAADWRITWHEWPFGTRAYSYGAAYTRWLAGAFGDRASVWKFLDAQAAMQPFVFDRGARGVVGDAHRTLLWQARQDLLAEQERQLAVLRSAPVTTLRRRTPLDLQVGAPAWRADGSLVFAAKPPQDRARLHTLQPDDALTSSGEPSWALASVRALPDGELCHDELNWRRLQRLVIAGTTLGWRLLQPDAGALQNGERTVVAVRLQDGGGQELVAFTLRDGELDAGSVLPTVGKPWTPALRPGHDGQLVWVETDRDGSRLVLGSLRDASARTVLWQVRGRLLHPCWASDGASLYVCADHTGTANAWRLDLLPDGPRVRSVTNTLGAVIACVPSPDGKQLALVDHDARGPFVATIANDEAGYAPSVPTIELAWPAPTSRPRATANPAAKAPTPLPALPAGAGDLLTVAPYDGLGELRPRFWAPTTFAVPTGGYGVYGLLSDPLFTHVVQAGAGVGFNETEPVAFVDYSYLAEVIEVGVRGGRSELTFAETVLRGAERFDYTETVAGGELRLGRGLFGLERQFLLYGAVGSEHHDEVDDSARDYAGGSYVKAPFRDTDGYVELTVGYDGSIAYPTSYTREDGLFVRGIYRHSGLWGELERNRALADGGYTWSVLPAAGHQLVVRGQLGWSDGDDPLQGNFSIGGGLTTGLPRGYLNEAVATGRHLLGASVAWRLPLWRPFAGGGTTPFRGRQLVLELFGDAAQISDQRPGGGSYDDWFKSVGAELFANAEFFDGIVSPGFGVAWQLDGEREVRAYFSLGFAF